MPTFVLAAKCCPPDVEATLFALLMGLANFGAVIGLYNGVALLHLFGGVEAPEFRRLPSFIATRTLCYLLPLALVYTVVPAGRPSDPAPSDAVDEAEVEMVAEPASKEGDEVTRGIV